jgi:FKBP-type peptidyl-prolyl cis-trans isomerase FkpA
MTRIWTLLLLCALPLGALADTAPAASAAKPAAAATPAATKSTAAMSDDDKVVYAIGLILSRDVASFEFNDHEKQLVRSGLADGLRDPKAAAGVDTYMAKIQALQGARAGKAAARTKAAGKAYRDKMAAAKGATTTASGIVMTTLKAGTGATPKADDQVKVHYEGRLIDGTIFDSSIQRGQPAVFKLSGVVPCWTEAVQQIHVGGKSRIVCPPELAYGDRGAGGGKIPGGATLVFDVELLDIVKAEAPAAPAAPAAAAAPATPATPANPPKPQ